MSFDSHSLERLRELGRKLPNSLPIPNTKSSKANQNTKAKLHPIETEEDPKKLFGELIKASPDGKVPSHLLDRLKKTESLNLEKQPLKESFAELDTNQKAVKSKNKSTNNNLFKDDLYISFQRLLLEEDD